MSLDHRRGGGRCTYCNRSLLPAHLGKNNSVTRDHHMPQHLGGRTWVACCRQCNQLKGSLTPAQWQTVMTMFPRWWLAFRTPGEVWRALRSLETGMETTA